MEMVLYSVLLEEDVPVDVRALGKPVAAVLRSTVLEARLRLRKGRGILLEDLTREQAQEIVRLLREANVPARAVAAEELPLLPAPRRVGEVRHGEESFLARLAEGGDGREIRWDDIAIVSAGAVARPEYEDLFCGIRFEDLPDYKNMEDPLDREIVRENLILKLQQGRPAGTETPDIYDRSAFERIEEKWGGRVRVYADLVTRGLDLWLRISMDEFAYVRREGSVKLGRSWGFTALIRNLRERVPAAFTEMTLKLASGGDIRGLVFIEFEQFHRYSNWAVLRRRFGGQEKCARDSSSPSPEPAGPPTEDGSSSSSPPPGPSST